MAMAQIKLVAGAALLGVSLTFAGSLRAAEEAPALLSRDWSHDGLFGTFDRSAAQRGFQVYREVCAACHGLSYIAFRNLREIGFDEEQVRAIAEQYQVTDGPNDQGEMFERPGRTSDYVPSPFPNEQAARAANGGALPPDLSLITKARTGDSDYLYSLLVGYEDAPPDAEGPEGMYYNAYFPGHWIAMPPPLNEGVIEYADGTEATIPQMSNDVTVFLSWAAEPTLEQRKGTGLKVLLFLIVLTALFYATKRKVWADAH
jgi:ubiquinol-cytochrome c reductase cytochrome c1 subunit